MFFSPSFLEQKFLITLFFCILELKSPILSFSFSGILFQYNGFFYIDLSLPLFSWFFRDLLRWVLLSPYYGVFCR